MNDILQLVQRIEETRSQRITHFEPIMVDERPNTTLNPYICTLRILLRILHLLRVISINSNNKFSISTLPQN